MYSRTMPTKRQTRSETTHQQSNKRSSRTLEDLSLSGLETETKKFRSYVVREVLRSASRGLGYYQFNALWLAWKFPAMNIMWNQGTETFFNPVQFLDIFKTEFDTSPKIETQDNNWVLIRWL